jgi:hypothetical protein
MRYLQSQQGRSAKNDLALDRSQKHVDPPLAQLEDQMRDFGLDTARRAGARPTGSTRWSEP